MADDEKKVHPSSVTLRTLTEEERSARAMALAEAKKLDVSPKTLTLKPRINTGTVRQSFSHGRSTGVVVERSKSRERDWEERLRAEEHARFDRLAISRRLDAAERLRSASSNDRSAAYEEAARRVEAARTGAAKGLFLADLASLDRLPPMGKLTEVRGLNLANTLISDLSPLKDIPWLRGLNLYKTLVTDISPLRELNKLRFLRLDGTLVSDLSPLAQTITLIQGANAHHGLESSDVLVEDEAVRKLGTFDNPKSTIETIGYLRNQLGLAPLDVEELGSTGWAERISQLRQAPLGARFLKRDDTLIIDPSGDDTDILAAADPLTDQLHDGVRRRARDFSTIAKRVDNQFGWKGLGEAAERFSKAVNRPIADVPAHIGTIYETIVALGSFLDLDARLRTGTYASDADPLDLEVQRAFSDLIRSAAPWVRRFPTARTLDDETGAFLTRKDLYEPAAAVISAAEATEIISEDDAKLLLSIIEAAKRGDYQGQKAGARGIFSSTNLVTAMAVILSLEVGMIGNEAAPKSLIAQKGAQFYLSAETYVMKLFEDAPDDIRQALLAMMDDLRIGSDNGPAKLPEKPRQHFTDRHGRTRELDEPA
jgi:hypothetical protein